ncbi:MAG: AraC family transcriptional regulator [Gammaproteobacteria bacterium]
MRVLAEVLRDVGQDPRPLLARCGLPADLRQLGAGVSPSQHMTFIRASLAATGRPDLGLVVGQRHRLPMFGFWGLALATSPNLGSAARIGIQYADLTHTLLRWSFRRGGRLASLAMRPARPLDDLETYLVEADATAVATLLRDLLGRSTVLSEARFAYPAPGWRDAYGEAFACPVVFGAPRHELMVATSMLEAPLPGSDPLTAATAEAECRRLLHRLGPGGGLTTRLRRLLLASGGGLPSQARAADALCVSERTLRRRLGEEGTSFRKVADGVRFELVSGYLRDTSLPLEEIAARTGFSDAANLSHAFRRWTGQTPGGWRQAAHEAGEGD